MQINTIKNRKMLIKVQQIYKQTDSEIVSQLVIDFLFVIFTCAQFQVVNILLTVKSFDYFFVCNERIYNSNNNKKKEEKSHNIKISSKALSYRTLNYLNFSNKL